MASVDTACKKHICTMELNRNPKLFLEGTAGVFSLVKKLINVGVHCLQVLISSRPK